MRGKGHVFRHGKTRGRAIAAAAAALMLFAAPDAHAAITVDVSVDTTYAYGFLGAASLGTGANLSYRNGASVAGYPAEFGLDFKTTGSGGSFDFLHNQYCVGKCTVYSLTTVTVTLKNAGVAAEAMRFDSQITAGHLARQGINSDSSAVFDFSVTQKTGNSSHLLYSASGIADATQTEITTSDGIAFNGLTRSSNGDAWDVLDWSATNLNLNLDSIAAGDTSTLIYSSMTRVATTASTCADLTDCPGVQVAFGDPRNNGASANFRAFALGAKLAPVIGQLYKAAKIDADVVEADAPLPPQPKILPRVTYGAPFVSQLAAVPEPASWMTMLLGFGFLGVVLRRRVPRLATRAV